MAPFLTSRRKEVADIMTTLFDQEKVWEIELKNVAKQTRREGALQSIRALMETMQVSVDRAMDLLKVPESERGVLRQYLDEQQ